MVTIHSNQPWALHDRPQSRAQIYPSEQRGGECLGNAECADEPLHPFLRRAPQIGISIFGVGLAGEDTDADPAGGPRRDGLER